MTTTPTERATGAAEIAAPIRAGPVCCDQHQELEPLGSDALTPAEHRTLALIATGRTNAEIAATVYCGIDTVKGHIKHLYIKLRARNRAHAVAIAYQQGLFMDPKGLVGEKVKGRNPGKDDHEQRCPQ